MDFIKQLYYGNISPAAQHFEKSGKYAKALNEIVSLQDEITEGLSKKEIQELEKLFGLQAELLSLSSEENYIKGFRDGAKLMLDVVLGDEKNFKNIT